MKTVTIYGIKNCDSLNREKIEYWLTQIDLSKLFNKRSTTYRNLKLKELNLDENGEIEWLSKENLLIKRPVIEYEDKVIIGFNQDSYNHFFGYQNSVEE